MAKKEYEKIVVHTTLLSEADVITFSLEVEDGDGENYGTANKDWYKGGGF